MQWRNREANGMEMYSIAGLMSNWEFEQAEAKATRFTKQSNVKNDTIYHILLANMKGKSISEFVERRTKLLPINVF